MLSTTPSRGPLKDVPLTAALALTHILCANQQSKRSWPLNFQKEEVKMKQVVAIMTTVLVLVSVSFAGNASNVGKAKDFIKAGMYPQAIELLDKEVHKNPTNAEAHFELGNIWGQT
jgi:hypothetical protein